VTVEMYLRDMLYVSYLLPTATVRPHVPASLSLAEAEKDRVFITVVMFRGTTRKGLGIPSPPIPFDQVNIRTYVIDPVTGKPAVHFIHCGVAQGLIAYLYRLLSGMPVEYAPFRITVTGSRGDLEASYRVAGKWRGNLLFSARRAGERLDDLPPFGTRKEAMDHLIDPLTGFYTVSGGLRRLEIYHDPLDPVPCILEEAFFPYLSALGLVGGDAIGTPHNVLFVKETPFLIYLPAQKMAG
jgi:hypothetical protein